MATRIEEISGQLRAKRATLAPLFEKKSADGRFNWTAEERDQVRTLNTECDALGTELDGLRADAQLEVKHAAQMTALNAVQVPGSHGGPAPARRRGARSVSMIGTDGFGLMEGKSIGEHFIEHKGYTDRGGAKSFGFAVDDFEVKTLFSTTAGFDPFVNRSPLIVMSAQQQPRIVDLVPVSETSQPAIKWMLETVYTNAADTTAQAGAYPEAALQYAEQISAVVKIAVFLPTTDEQLADEPRMRDVLNSRLGLMLRQKLDQKLVTGPGGGTDIMGLLNLVGTQTQAKGADSAPSAVFKAMTLIQTVAFGEPSGVLFNPTDWQNIKLLQTADGLYIWGHPSEASPNRIWGLPVVSSTYQTLGTAVVADFMNYTELVYRQGITFDVSNSHVDYFTSGKQAIRAGLRVAFVVTRPAAVAKVTGL